MDGRIAQRARKVCHMLPVFKVVAFRVPPRPRQTKVHQRNAIKEARTLGAHKIGRLDIRVDNSVIEKFSRSARHCMPTERPSLGDKTQDFRFLLRDRLSMTLQAL